MPEAAALAAFFVVPIPPPVAGQAVAPPTSAPTDAGCTVSPRTVADVAAVAGSAATPDLATPRPGVSDRQPRPVGAGTPLAVPQPLPIELPQGPPAPPATAAAVAETLRQFVACANAGEPLRLMALVSDDLIRDGFAGVPMSEEAVAAYVTPSRPLPPEERRAVVAIRNVQILEGGRVAALLDWTRPLGPSPNRVQTDYVVLVRERGGWVVDLYVANVGDRKIG